VLSDDNHQLVLLIGEPTINRAKKRYDPTNLFRVNQNIAPSK